MICFRLLNSKDPAQPLANAVRALAVDEATNDTYEVEAESFRHIPNAPFAYWVSEKVRTLFVSLPAFEANERTAKVGLQTSDDFRFVRDAWETPVDQKELSKHAWFDFAKGGSYSPFYADISLKINWENNGKELDAFSGSVLRNTEYYFQVGLFQTLRASRLAPHLTPAGCLFGHNGFQAFNLSKKTFELLGILNSKTVEFLYKMQLGRDGFALYLAGTLQNTPIPKICEQSSNSLKNASYLAWSSKRKPDTSNLNSHAFYAPALAPSRVSSTQGSK